MAIQEFVIFRHAHKADWSADPELSPDGHRQAQLIAKLVRSNILPTPDLLLCSPKKRSEQTFTPMRDDLNIPLIIDPALDERGNAEKGRLFENRVKRVIEVELPARPQSCVFLCTHLDWLEIFGWMAPIDTDITAEVIHMPPANFYHIGISTDPNALWRLIRKGKVD